MQVCTSECPRKEKSKDVKCVLCEGNYPANYKGCNVYKELQQKSFPTLRNKVIIPTKNPNFNKIQPGTSFAQIVAPSSEQEIEQTQQSSEMKELKSMLKMMMEQMSTMLTVLNTVLSKMV